MRYFVINDSVEQFMVDSFMLNLLIEEDNDYSRAVLSLFWDAQDTIRFVPVVNDDLADDIETVINTYLNVDSAFDSIFPKMDKLCVICDENDANIPTIIHGGEYRGYTHYECFETQNQTLGGAQLDIDMMKNILAKEERIEMQEDLFSGTPVVAEESPSYRVTLSIPEARTLWMLFWHNNRQASAHLLEAKVKELGANPRRITISVKPETVLFIIENRHTYVAPKPPATNGNAIQVTDSFVRKFTSPVERAGDDLEIPCQCPNHDSNYREIQLPNGQNDYIRLPCHACGDKHMTIASYWKDYVFHAKYERIPGV